ncbi:GATA-binding factor 2 [Fundulus heteroclitus]|uniref:GATA-binding factor 2 n=1 Tax=Fundulus heteroclitus TaxID=8078 RepID=UPI00165CBB65|nr:GATA-binding factor 2 [Fundulus heteroclitus]
MDAPVGPEILQDPTELSLCPFPLRRTEMMSGLPPSAAWSSAPSAPGWDGSPGFSVKCDPAPSDPLVQSRWLSDEGLLRRPHPLDDEPFSCWYRPPPLYSTCSGHPTLTPPPRWNSNLLGPSPSSPDWSDPEQRECESCGANSALLWRRAAAGKHLCYTCSLGQEDGSRDRNTPLLRPKRRRTAAARKGTRCSNCETETTSLWRRNAAGEPVCNACGLYYKLHQIQRPLVLKKEEIQTRRRKVANRRTCRKRADQSGSFIPSIRASCSSLLQ